MNKQYEAGDIVGRAPNADKHEVLRNAIGEIGEVTARLESLLERIEGPKTASNVGIEEPPVSPLCTLAEILSDGPDVITRRLQMARDAISKIENRLF